MKFRECPDCGAHLDHGETCDCKKKEDTPDAAGMPSKDVNANDVNSLSNLFPNVNDCFRLREVRELTGVQAKDLSKLVQSRFPKFTRQIMSQCESYDKYGCLKDLTFGARGEQHITVTVTSDFTQSFDDLKDYDISVEIKRWREPRSKDANAYFHVLVNKIAEAQSLGNDEVKRQLVLEYGTLATDETGSVLGAMIPSNASLDDFYPYAKWYKSMVVNDREYDCYLFFKRTHTLDSKEMARLIDGTIYVAKGLGLETMTPDQLARLEGYEKDL